MVCLSWLNAEDTVQKCCTLKLKLIARFVPLCVINLVSFLSFGKSSSRAWWVQGKESQSSSKSSHTTQGLHLSSHYTTPQQTADCRLMLEQIEPSPLLCLPFSVVLCASRNAGQSHPGTALATEIYCDSLCNKGESPGVLLLCFHCTPTDKEGLNDEWQVLQSCANKLRWQIKFHQIFGSMNAPGIVWMQAGRDDISDSFMTNKMKEGSPLSEENSKL